MLRGHLTSRLLRRILPRDAPPFGGGLVLALLTLQVAALLVRLLLELSEVVGVLLALGLLVEQADHFVVVPLALALVFLDDELLVDDPHQLLEAVAHELRRDLAKVGLVEQEPVRVLALEDRELVVEEGPMRLEGFVARHLPLHVVCRVNQVIEHSFFHLVELFLLGVRDDLLDLFARREASPHDHLELAEHEQLHRRPPRARITIRTRDEISVA